MGAMPSRLTRERRRQVEGPAKAPTGSHVGRLAAAKLRAARARHANDQFEVARSTVEQFKHAPLEQLLQAGFEQAVIGPHGVQDPWVLGQRGLGQVVFEYEDAEGKLLREAGWLDSLHQNHLTLLQGPDLQPRQFINTCAHGPVKFKSILIRDSGLDNVKGWDARRLIAGEAPTVAWLHVPSPESGEPKFVFGAIKSGAEHSTLTTPDGREFKFHPDHLDELARKGSRLSASLVPKALPHPIPVSRVAPPRDLIGHKKPDKSTPYVATPSPEQARAHQRITRELFNGDIEVEHDLHLGVVWKVKLKNVDPVTGEVVVTDAILKARVPGDKRTWDAPDYYNGYGRTPMEYVGYFVNRLLGMDVVAPTAYRRGLNLQLPNGRVVTEAALIHYVPDLTTQVFELPISSDAKVLAGVIRDNDLNVLNYGSGVHWVDGKLHDVKIDMAAAGSGMHGIGGSPPGVDSIRRSVYEALKKWSAEDLRPVVDAGFISWKEAESYIENGRRIVARIDDLVATAGGDVAMIITPN